jgi:hypothetical protein
LKPSSGGAESENGNTIHAIPTLVKLNQQGWRMSETGKAYIARGSREGLQLGAPQKSKQTHLFVHALSNRVLHLLDFPDKLFFWMIIYVG